MNYAIYLSPAAMADMTLAVDLYNSKVTDLGKRMAQEVNDTLEKIALSPKLYSIRYKDYRAAKLSSFPFLVFYRIKERTTSVQVLRIFHTSRRPFWTE